MGLFSDCGKIPTKTGFMSRDNSHKTKELYQFGVFRLDATERQLWCKNEQIHLTPKQFDLLFYFLENSGRTLKKSELLDAVWADSYVEETTLTRNVSWLRNKLIESADGKPIIETVPKLGYRFTAEVNRLDENTLIFEEQTIQNARGEEVITIDEADLSRKRKSENQIDALPKDSLSSRQPFFSVSQFLVAALGIVVVIVIGFIIYQTYFKTHAPVAILASQIVPFSALPGSEDNPSFSPDGNYLTYSWRNGEGNEGDIYIKLVDTGEPTQLTRTKENEQYPVFSPDGKYIAFIRGKYGEPGDLLIIPTIGGAERRIARLFSGNYSISFSPDGQNIAVIDSEKSTAGEQFAVYLINIQTGERRRVTTPAEFIGETTPRFSPDGKSLAFIRIAKDANPNTLGKQDLFVVPVKGGEPRQITFDGAIINSLAWDADSKGIYFTSYRLTNQPKIWRIAASGGEPAIVPTGAKGITNIAVSPDGKRLVITEKTELTSIRRVLPDGQPGTRLFDSTVSTYFPHFSPDGSRIVFHSKRGKTYQIWMIDADGKNLRQITDTPFDAGAPQFSPDGSRIAFNEFDEEVSRDFAVYTISIQGGVPKRISPEVGKNVFAAWSFDGKYIYFNSTRAGEINIWRINSDGSGEALQITKNGAYRALPSPDGKTVFYTKENILDQMWSVPAEGGAEEIVPEFTAAGFFSRWTITKKGIYFLSRSSDQSVKLKIYDFANQQIKDAPGNYKISGTVDNDFISTDGNVLLYNVMESTSRLMLADLPQR